MPKPRRASIEMDPEEFQRIGYQLVDDISRLIFSMDQKPVTPGERPSELQDLLGDLPLPEKGTSPSALMARTTDLLFEHSLFNGHPKFLGYITSSAAPLGALADLLAAAVNPNVGAHILSPIATEIERQTIRWLSEFIGLSPGYGGLLVSGGNMANFTAFRAAVTARAPKSIKEEGMRSSSRHLTLYCSKTTHTWIEKAAILFGLGARSIRWIPTGPSNKMDNQLLEEAIRSDLEKGAHPIMVVGTAGDVSTGAVDDLAGISAICKAYDLWFHIDGAYGIPAAVIPELEGLFEGIRDADSIALDPHKWLYSPLEAGCTLVKDPQHLVDTYSSHPEYYNFGGSEKEFAQNYYEYGLQNSRGFRALKVWLILQQVGREGFEELIQTDISLSEKLFDLVNRHPELEGVSQNLSIATFRYSPSDRAADPAYLNELNQELLNELQTGGEVFLSNAVVDNKYCLRACIVNFRTSVADLEEIIQTIIRKGRQVHLALMDQKKK